MARPRNVRVRTLWPLPGGAGSYLIALERILASVRGSADDADAIATLMRSFPAVTSPKTARSYLRVAASLGLAELDGPWIALTDEGEDYLSDPDPAKIRQLLIDRIDGVRELLSIIGDHPSRVGLLLQRMKLIGYEWETTSQIRYRLRWLEEVGAIQRHGSARPFYTLP